MFKQKIKSIVLMLMLALGTGSALGGEVLNSYYYYEEDDFVKRLSETLNSLALKRDIHINTYYAHNSHSLQINQIYSNIYDGNPMLVNMQDLSFAAEVAYHARTHRNRVIFFNRKPTDMLFKQFDNVWYVGTNSTASGIRQAEMIEDYIKHAKNADRNGNGTLDVVILQGEKNNVDSQVRTRLILDSLKKYRLNVVSQNFDDWSYNRAFEDLKRLDKKKGGLDKVDMIISNNDAMAIGALRYLNNRGYNQEGSFGDASRYIPVFGADGLPEALELVKKKQLAGTIFADFSTFAKVILDIAFSDFTRDKDLQKLIWFKVQNRTVNIPYTIHSVYQNVFFD